MIARQLARPRAVPRRPHQNKTPPHGTGPADRPLLAADQRVAERELLGCARPLARPRAAERRPHQNMKPAHGTTAPADRPLPPGDQRVAERASECLMELARAPLPWKNAFTGAVARQCCALCFPIRPFSATARASEEPSARTVACAQRPMNRACDRLRAPTESRRATKKSVGACDETTDR